jgi:hypothetical protein
MLIVKKIEVFESPISDNVIAEFKTMAAFEFWMENVKNPRVDIFADSVAVNDEILLGWDELEDYRDRK